MKPSYEHIEVPVGEVVKRFGKIYRCVKGGTDCRFCSFKFNRPSLQDINETFNDCLCPELVCSAATRSDETEVMFREEFKLHTSFLRRLFCLHVYRVKGTEVYYKIREDGDFMGECSITTLYCEKCGKEKAEITQRRVYLPGQVPSHALWFWWKNKGEAEKAVLYSKTFLRSYTEAGEVFITTYDLRKMYEARYPGK